MPARKTQAIVIRAFPFREFHKIITFYTPQFGKVKAIAYGAKSSKSKLTGSLELLNHGTLIFNYRENRELQNITDFNLMNGFDAMRSNFTCLTYGCYFAELVDAIESEDVANPQVFNLLRHTYQFLPHATDVTLLARAFEIKLLDCVGYAPELSRCAYCGSKITAEILNFSVKHGGLLCPACEYRDVATFSIASGSCNLLKRLRHLQIGGQTASELNRLHASPRNHRELKQILGSFIAYHTERNLKSIRFIERTLNG